MLMMNRGDFILHINDKKGNIILHVDHR